MPEDWNEFDPSSPPPPPSGHSAQEVAPVVPSKDEPIARRVAPVATILVYAILAGLFGLCVYEVSLFTSGEIFDQFGVSGIVLEFMVYGPPTVLVISTSAYVVLGLTYSPMRARQVLGFLHRFYVIAIGVSLLQASTSGLITNVFLRRSLVDVDVAMNSLNAGKPYIGNHGKYRVGELVRVAALIGVIILAFVAMRYGVPSNIRALMASHSHAHSYVPSQERLDNLHNLISPYNSIPTTLPQ